MAKGFRGGFSSSRSSGAPHMQKMMQQAQAMQREMEKEQAALSEEVFEGTSGGGAVKVTMTGDKKIKALEIKPEVVDPEDIEMLQDLIISAVNETSDAIDAKTEEVMSKYTVGL